MSIGKTPFLLKRFFVYCLGALYGQFGDCAVGLVDRLIGVRRGRGVRVRYRNPAKGLAGDFARLFPGWPVRIEKSVVLVCVPVRPTVDRNGIDVPRGIEASRTQHTKELIADVALENLKRRRQQISPACDVLLPLRQAR